MKKPLLVGLAIAAQLAHPACARHEPAPGQQSPVAPPPGADGPSPAQSAAVAITAFGERVEERERMVRTTMEARDIRNQRVLEAMRRVPRHGFVPKRVRHEAYADHPLPIGGGQTISQPYIVAFMTQAARPGPEDRCLEIGTGSGYQAAVLAELCGSVYSIEYLPEVARVGRENLRRLGYAPERVQLRVGDGYRGWPEASPFQVILVTAAPERVPPPLLQQLDVGGRLVAPVGPQSRYQELELWTRRRPGSKRDAFEVERMMTVRFVPFLGDELEPSAPDR